MDHLSKFLQECLQSDGYPIIKIPQRIKEILGEIVPIPNAPRKPDEPKKPVLIIPSPPSPPKKTTLSWFGLDKDYRLLMLDYERRIQQHPKLSRELKERYERQLKEYEKDLENYEQKFSDYKNDLDYHQHISRLSTSEINDKNSRNELLFLHLFTNASSASPLPENSKFTKGISEVYFEKFLIEHFKKNIVTVPSTIISEDYERFYVPDFILRDSILHIDIEIDEPYVAASHKPTHYLEDLNEKKRDRSRNFIPENLQHIDRKRDDFFLSNNWIVVRFTERQIVESPQDCIRLLDELINYVWIKTEFQHSLSLYRIRTEPKWTRYSAVSLADRQYRQSYLPPMLAQAVTDARNAYLKDNPQVYNDDNDLPF